MGIVMGLCDGLLSEWFGLGFWFVLVGRSQNLFCVLQTLKSC
jgi:hypothetical protein